MNINADFSARIVANRDVASINMDFEVRVPALLSEIKAADKAELRTEKDPDLEQKAF
jgi:Cu/Ag efflux protein CusF